MEELLQEMAVMQVVKLSIAEMESIRLELESNVTMEIQQTGMVVHQHAKFKIFAETDYKESLNSVMMATLLQETTVPHLVLVTIIRLFLLELPQLLQVQVIQTTSQYLILSALSIMILDSISIILLLEICSSIFKDNLIMLKLLS